MYIYPGSFVSDLLWLYFIINKFLGFGQDFSEKLDILWLKNY